MRLVRTLPSLRSLRTMLFSIISLLGPTRTAEESGHQEGFPGNVGKMCFFFLWMLVGGWSVSYNIHYRLIESYRYHSSPLYLYSIIVTIIIIIVYRHYSPHYSPRCPRCAPLRSLSALFWALVMLLLTMFMSLGQGWRGRLWALRETCSIIASCYCCVTQCVAWPSHHLSPRCRWW